MSPNAERGGSCGVGGFNVSNLMGIKRRMIDIGKKITFYFLQNVWKWTVFFAFAFKVCKSAIMTQKFFFLKNNNMGIKKRRILCWLQIRWCRLKQMPLKKLEPNNYANFEYFRLRIWNQHKILRFLIPILIFYKKRIFWVIIALFAFLKCKCEKNCTFSNILQKVKSYFFAHIYQSLFDSYWNSKKSIKLKPPIAGSQPMSTAVNSSPNKFWRSNSIFNQWKRHSGQVRVCSTPWDRPLAMMAANVGPRPRSVLNTRREKGGWDKPPGSSHWARPPSADWWGDQNKAYTVKKVSDFP